jgi:hypothetical protein
MKFDFSKAGCSEIVLSKIVVCTSQKEMTGNLVQQLDESLKYIIYIISKLNLRYDIESQKGGARLVGNSRNSGTYFS